MISPPCHAILVFLIFLVFFYFPFVKAITCNSLPATSLPWYSCFPIFPCFLLYVKVILMLGLFPLAVDFPALVFSASQTDALTRAYKRTSNGAFNSTAASVPSPRPLALTPAGSQTTQRFLPRSVNGVSEPREERVTVLVLTDPLPPSWWSWWWWW